jgi:hypothetical protein
MLPLMIAEQESLVMRIRQGMERQGRYLVAAPSERAQIGDWAAAKAFATWHGWMVVSHLNGESYEFFPAIDSPQQALF